MGFRKITIGKRKRKRGSNLSNAAARSIKITNFHLQDRNIAISQSKENLVDGTPQITFYYTSNNGRYLSP